MATIFLLSLYMRTPKIISFCFKKLYFILASDVWLNYVNFHIRNERDINLEIPVRFTISISPTATRLMAWMNRRSILILERPWMLSESVLKSRYVFGSAMISCYSFCDIEAYPPLLSFTSYMYVALGSNFPDCGCHSPLGKC